MNYNILLETKNSTRSLLDRDENTIKRIVLAFKENKEFIFVDTEKFYTGELIEIQVYEFNNQNFQTGKELYNYCESKYKLGKELLTIPYVPKNILEQVGKKVTGNFINDNELEEIESKLTAEIYVNVNRIKELEKIRNINYDLSRLISILKEINVCNKYKLKFAIPPLIRSVIDQVPPIFGKLNFSEVCGSYGSKSFKESMKILDNNSRKIADSFLHTKIRKNESALPTETQINFKSELDVLLQEIVRIT